MWIKILYFIRSLQRDSFRIQGLWSNNTKQPIIHLETKTLPNSPIKSLRVKKGIFSRDILFPILCIRSETNKNRTHPRSYIIPTRKSESKFKIKPIKLVSYYPFFCLRTRAFMDLFSIVFPIYSLNVTKQHITQASNSYLCSSVFYFYHLAL